ncbi:nitric-oxide reductase large subunit [uncultured Brevundimonas sp.]|uniref:nitric-oxide reductase large subunit n=1 Tax=uncultured Brevundimonas sp. TaxID=213418 RepID=UPI002611BE66|nr:nitric-oxide reductase large subunit [uncultured Brevundimonas sp.]
MTTYAHLFTLKRLWLILAVSMFVMFGALLWFGREIYHAAPPIPERVQTTEGQTLYTLDDIQRGQNVWQAMGGMQQGSIWGHGGYLAPDWSADWLHREASALLDIRARAEGSSSFASLSPREQAADEAELRVDMRRNTYDPATGVVTITPERAAAIAVVQSHFRDLYQASTPEAQKLRVDYAFPVHTRLSDADAHAVAAFYFWTSWAASTERPGKTITYTSNWPHEPLVGNEPTAAILLWSLISILVLLGGIGALVWFYAREFDVWRADSTPDGGFATFDFMDKLTLTPSMRATAKYFWLVLAMFGAQVLLGIVTAHYQVEGQGLYGLPFAEYVPYAVTRTWHTQLAVLWIAVAWLAAGLYVAPLLSGKDPKFQVWGVNFLFVSLIVIVVGSFAGQWAAVNGFFRNLTANFWFGHQGYEYTDLGRFWQIYLFIGLMLWVLLVLRGLWPLLRRKGGVSLILLVAISTVAIGLLFGASLMWGEKTHISIMEYWRWWVVHLWVEGVFEVFATAIVSALLVRMGLVRPSVAATAVLVATIVFLSGGVLGTFHHLYFSGTPIGVIALGSVLSALEVVPLAVVGFEAYNRSKLEGQNEWEEVYHWPFRFFAAVLFWNLVGAGLLGFLINTPIALYYMQGLNTTASHGHAALFGVYGMLGLGLVLYCMRGLTNPRIWNQRLLSIAFWCLNIGLAMMTFLSLLPQGLWQTYVSFNENYAAARSAELMHHPIMEGLVWARVPGDVVFAVGVGAFVLFAVKAFWGSRRRG